MNVKRYFAEDMQELMGRIREELGPDAVILSSKQVKRKGIKGFFSKPVNEVMVAYDDPAPRRAPQPPAAQLSSRAAASVAPAYRQSAGQSPAPVRPPQTYGQTQREQNELVQSALDAAFAQQMQNIAREKVAPVPPNASLMPDIQPFNPPVVSAQEQKPAPAPAPAESRDDEKHVGEMMNEELTNIKRMLSDVAGQVQRMSEQPPPTTEEKIPLTLLPLYKRMRDLEVEEGLALTLTREAQALMRLDRSLSPEDALSKRVRETMGAPAHLSLRKGKQNTVLMLGPTGVGKTTSLVKLAAQCVIRDGLRVGMINADTFRIAAEQQLMTYAEILDAPMRMAYSPDEIPSIISSMDGLDVVFIDTPGKRPSDEEHKEEIKRLVEICKPDEIFLVISAPSSARACRSVISHYGFLSNYKIIVTKLDETDASGIVLTACHLSGRPIAYIANGQNVPDDIAVADPEHIAHELIRDELV